MYPNAVNDTTHVNVDHHRLPSFWSCTKFLQINFKGAFESKLLILMKQLVNATNMKTYVYFYGLLIQHQLTEKITLKHKE